MEADIDNAQEDSDYMGLRLGTPVMIQAIMSM
jgi:hypothetical protein